MWFFNFVISVRGGRVSLLSCVKQHTYASAPTLVQLLREQTNTGISSAPSAKTTIDAHTPWRIFLTCDISPSSLTLPAPEVALLDYSCHTVFCDRKTCSLLGTYRRFENTCYLNFQRSLPWKQCVPLNHQQIPTSLRGTTSNTAIFFTSIVVKTSSFATMWSLPLTS
jgi:hypothetical protein